MRKKRETWARSAHVFLIDIFMLYNKSINMKEKKSEKMKKIKDEVINLENSALAKNRKETKALPVIGEGNHNADIVFIGEAPGKNEAKYGRPFCGRAGDLLDELLESIKLEREKVYITNIVKDRPPQNRDPQPEEIATYGPFLDRQIEIIEPKVIATLGRYAMSYILNLYEIESNEGISKMHGTIHKADEISIVPLYHPAVAIYNQHLKETLLKDFKVLKQFTPH